MSGVFSSNEKELQYLTLMSFDYSSDAVDLNGHII